MNAVTRATLWSATRRFHLRQRALMDKAVVLCSTLEYRVSRWLVLEGVAGASLGDVIRMLYLPR